jgi:tetratricopeptide (TPR) repeat protein
LYREGKVEEACKKYTRALVLLESLSMSPAVTDLQRARVQAQEAWEKEVKRRADAKKRLERLGKPVPEELFQLPENKVVSWEEVNGPLKASDMAFDPSDVLNLMDITRLNYAACKLKMGDYNVVIIQCTEVLKSDGTSIKALFRRAQAYLRIGRDLELAEKDLNTLKNIFKRKNISETSPEWLEVKRIEKEVEKKVTASRKKEKEMYSNIFV